LQEEERERNCLLHPLTRRFLRPLTKRFLHLPRNWNSPHLHQNDVTRNCQQTMESQWPPFQNQTSTIITAGAYFELRDMSMNGRVAGSIVIFALIASLFSLVITILPENVEARTLYVGGSGGDNYTKIQDAINDADPGDTIFVYSGTYNEDISVFKSLTLIGENRISTKVRGSGLQDVIIVTRDGVSITGFTVENSGYSLGFSGIRLFFVQNCRVTDNIAFDNYNGITAWYSDGNIVQNNIASNNLNGIYLEFSRGNRIADNHVANNSVGIYPFMSEDTTITDNTISDNLRGIFLWNSASSVLTNNVMTGGGIYVEGDVLKAWNTHDIDTSNTVDGRLVRYWKNATGGTVPLNAGQVILANCMDVVVENQDINNVFAGINVGFSSYTTISDNDVWSNYYAGIHLSHSNNNEIKRNDASNSGNAGIYLMLSEGNTVTENTASSNDRSGIYLDASDRNTITDNNLSLNGQPDIHLSTSHHNTIAYHETRGSFFWLESSHYNDISNNIFSGDLGNRIFLTVSDENTIANNTAISSTFSIFLRSSNRNLIADNIWLSFAGPIELWVSNDNTLRNNYVQSLDWASIILRDSRSHILVNNVVTGTGVYVTGRDLMHWNTHEIDTSNTVNGRPVRYWKNVTGGTIPLGAAQVILANCSNVVVENQNFSKVVNGINMGFSSNNTITSNTFSNNGGSIQLFRSHNNRLADSDMSSNEWGIALTLSDHNTVTGINSWDNNGNGISLSGSDYNIITDNLFRDNRDGIRISDYEYGMVLENSYGNIVTENDILSHRGSGIRIRESFNNTATLNNISSNEKGVQLIESGDNWITLNNIVNNLQGIALSVSSNNWIYHNSIDNNSLQAFDDRSNNQWDDGYPSGGNYWSDYTGVDMKSGPNQDLPGNDGIGDTPYVIDADSEDRYPLTDRTLFPLLPPYAPQKLQADPGNRQITLTWNPPTSPGSFPITNYMIYRGTVSGGQSFLTKVGNVTQHVDTGLTNGQTYYYYITAFNGVGEGPRSNEANATPSGPPAAPILLQARLTGYDFENVTITWELSADDGAGQKSVVRYEIYKNMTYDPDALGYSLSGSVPNGTNELTIKFVGEGDPNNYFYRICAVDMNSRMNCTKDQVAKYTRPLAQGPNLVSIPLIQSDESIEVVLQTVNWDKAWSYRSYDSEWKSYMSFKPYNGDMTRINHTMGVWVNVVEESNLTVAGIVPVETTIQLYAGWNLVGFPSFKNDYTVADLRAALPIDRVEGFDASAPYYLKLLQDSDVLQAGYGYWLRLETDAVWQVDSG
jgi:parallel beta-helix repeat protein